MPGQPFDPSVDYYRVLGIHPSASGDEIKRAYRGIARENHPDAVPGDRIREDKFKSAAGAYEVLGNPDKRAQYDRLRAAPRGGSTANTTANTRRGSGLGDVVGDLGNMVGAVLVDLARDAVSGSQGAPSRTQGRTSSSQPGRSTRGGGRVLSASDGSPLRRERGGDVSSDIRVPLSVALLGGIVRIPTIDGEVEARIPAGTSCCRKIVLRGRGTSIVGEVRDHYVTIHVDVPDPSSLDEDARASLRKLVDGLGRVSKG